MCNEGTLRQGTALLVSHVEKLGGFNTEFLGQFGVDQLGHIDKIAWEIKINK